MFPQNGGCQLHGPKNPPRESGERPSLVQREILPLNALTGAVPWVGSPAMSGSSVDPCNPPTCVSSDHRHMASKWQSPTPQPEPDGQALSPVQWQSSPRAWQELCNPGMEWGCKQHLVERPSCARLREPGIAALAAPQSVSPSGGKIQISPRKEQREDSEGRR